MYEHRTFDNFYCSDFNSEPAWSRPCGQPITLLERAELAARQAAESFENARSYFIGRAGRLDPAWLTNLVSEHVANMPLPMNDSDTQHFLAVSNTTQVAELVHEHLSSASVFLEEIMLAESKDLSTSKTSRRILTDNLALCQTKINLALCALKSLLAQYGKVLESASRSLYGTDLRNLSDAHEHTSRLWRGMRDYIVLRDSTALLTFHVKLLSSIRKV